MPADQAQAGIRPWVLLALVIAGNYGYDPAATYFPDPVRASRWLFYVFQGAQAAALFGWLLILRLGLIASLACWLGLWQELQVTVCGITAFGSTVTVPAYSGLCVQTWGGKPYAALAALLVVLLIRNIRGVKKNEA